jgi:hypothetical protein
MNKRKTNTAITGGNMQLLQFLTLSVAVWLSLTVAFRPSSHRYARRSRSISYNQQQKLPFYLEGSTSSENDVLFFAATSSVSVVKDVKPPNQDIETNGATAGRATPEKSRRPLGSQELLMLPRQYKLGDAVFPQMNHVSCVVLKCSTPINVTVLGYAIDAAVSSHPLLSARVIGDGEPVRRIDALKMVRSWMEPEPDPLLFVSGTPYTSDDILTVVEVDDVDRSWKEAFVRDLDDGSWCNITSGPLWKVELHQQHTKLATDKNGPFRAELVFSFNHAISDQSSVNCLTDQILRHISEFEDSGQIGPVTVEKMPVTIEDSVLGLRQRWSDVQTSGISFDTIKYVTGKALEGLKSPVILPDRSSALENINPLGALTIISGRAAGGQDTESSKRKSTVQFRSLSKESTEALLRKCRSNGVSISNALTAAITYTASDFVGNNADTGNSPKSRNYKILQSLDMRRFGVQLDQCETVACMAGSHDLMHGPLPDFSGAAIRRNPSEQRLDKFWKLALEGKRQTKTFIESDGPSQAVRVFDFAMTISDLNNLVHLTAQSKDTKGRAYSAGVTNAGVYESQRGFRLENGSDRMPLRVQHGRYEIEDIYYATPHVTSGCLYQVSALTVNGQLKFTFHPVEPIVSAETNSLFADAFVELLDTLSTETAQHIESNTDMVRLSLQALPTACAAFGLVSVLSHGGAWATFITSVLEMKANVANPADFWSALNFWIFFAVGHPILQPILWISDILHGSPGPIVGGLVPASFIAGNILVIAAFTISKEV